MTSGPTVSTIFYRRVWQCLQTSCALSQWCSSVWVFWSWGQSQACHLCPAHPDRPAWSLALCWVLWHALDKPRPMPILLQKSHVSSVSPLWSHCLVCAVIDPDVQYCASFQLFQHIGYGCTVSHHDGFFGVIVFEHNASGFFFCESTHHCFIGLISQPVGKTCFATKHPLQPVEIFGLGHFLSDSAAGS